MLDKVPTNDVAAAEIKTDYDSQRYILREQIKKIEDEIEKLNLLEKTERSKLLEWGAEFDIMSWDNTQTKIAELNKSLTEGEKPWRLPTVDELVTEFNKTGSTPTGFRDSFYWATGPSDLLTYTVCMRDGTSGTHPKGYAPLYVRLVR